MRVTTRASTWAVYADGVLVGDVYRAPNGTYDGEPLSQRRALVDKLYHSVGAAARAVARTELGQTEARDG